MGDRQRPWNIHEAAVLLEGCLEIHEGGLYRRVVISDVSRKLRTMAINQGELIDETFKNVAGITFQLQAMESALGIEGSYKPASQLFKDIVSLYHTDRPQYEKILHEAKLMERGEYTCGKEDIIRLNSLEERVRVELQKESARNRYGAVVAYIARLADCENVSMVRNILNKADWARVEYGRYHYVDLSERAEEVGLKEDVEENPLHDSEIDKTGEENLTEDVADNPIAEQRLDTICDSNIEQVTCIDFNAIDRLEKTQPTRFLYFDEEQGEFTSWKSLYVKFLSVLCDDYPEKFHENMSFSSRNGRLELALKENEALMVYPRDIPGTDFVVETNNNATDTVRKMKYLLDLCLVDYDNVVVYYSRVKSTLEKDAASTTELNKSTVISADSYISYDFTNATLFQGTVPVNCSVGGHEITAKNWGQTLVRLTELMLIRNPASMDILFEKSLHSKNEIPYLMSKNLDGLYCKELSNGYWICLHSSLPELVKMIARLAVHCGYTKDQIKLNGVPKRQVSDNAQQTDVSRTIDTTVHATPKEVYHNPAYEKVLISHFGKGFRLEFGMEYKKFGKYYAEAHGRELTDTPDAIRKEILKLCIVEGDRAYHPDSMVGSELKERLLAHIHAIFCGGAPTLYYQTLYDEFNQELAFSQIKNVGMLRSWLIHVNSGKYYAHKSFLSQEASVRLNPIEEIRTFMIAQGQPVLDEVVCKALPHLSAKVVKKLIKNEEEFIWNHADEHFHASVMQVTEKDLHTINDLLRQTIAEGGYMVDQELWDVLLVKLPSISENHPWLTITGFRLWLEQNLERQYKFEGKIISHDGRTASQILQDYVKQQDSFTMTEYLSLAKSLNVEGRIYPIFEYALRISHEQFVSPRLVHFDIDETDAVLSMYCTGEFLPLKEVDNFAILPDCGQPWSIFLVAQYCDQYSKRFKLIHPGYGQDSCAGVIVRRNSKIEDMDQLLTVLLASSDVVLQNDPALDWLVLQGIIVKRRYANISNILLRANALRLQIKDNN